MKRFFLAALSLLLLAGCATMRPGAGKAKAFAGKGEAPLIGISCGGSETMTTLKKTYSDAVRMAGGIPVLIPILQDSVVMEALVSHLDGVILSGGEDIDPRYFGEEHLPELGTVNAPRDTFDVLLIRTALRQRKPLLAICRGEQVLNVALGGSLYQDIPSQIPSSELKHRQDEPATVATQTIAIAEGSRLQRIVGVDSLAVNSHHHQAVKDLAPGLVITARTSDGVVEAYESLPGWDFTEGSLWSSSILFGQQGQLILAVQFHPEAFAQEGNPTFLKFFQDLVDRAVWQRDIIR